MAKVYVVGARGRMGQLVCATVEATEGLELAGGYDVDNIDELDEVAPAVDLVIDFSQPAALPHVIAYVERTGAALVSGTTGLQDADLARLRELGSSTRVVWASNYSLGVAVLRKVAAEAARALEAWDVEIVETHHNQKADAPSGTAVALLKAVDPQGAYDVVHGREGIVGARPSREIGMHALRGGTVAGTHEVHFFGTDEELCLTHRAASRQIFVAGAVACAQRLLAAKTGFHTFDELMLG
ncbi:MAG: 4-hydroxy-tetrahydrodipicolinate reductase [Atopobiaceae bacterium]|nr:4-hydroxy-tetrahydrodipicolinate reductase [Atopobiaceae bacterium]